MIIRKIRLTEYEYQPPINYVAGATEPDIQFQLADYTIPAGATARCYVQRFDGTFEYTVATIDGNNVTVEPTSSMFSVRGEGAIQITLYAGEEVLKNFSVPVFVHADLADENAEQGSNVTGIFRAAEEQALEDFQEAAEAKAAEVIESIPADYSELTEEVSELNERLDTYADYIGDPDTDLGSHGGSVETDLVSLTNYDVTNDGIHYVTTSDTVSASGTAAQTKLTTLQDISVTPGNYKFSIDKAIASSGFEIQLYNVDSSSVVRSITKTSTSLEYTFTQAASGTLRIRLLVTNGSVISESGITVHFYNEESGQIQNTMTDVLLQHIDAISDLSDSVGALSAEVGGFDDAILSLVGTDVTWEVGTIGGTDGQDASATTRLRTKGYIPLSVFEKATQHANGKFKHFCYGSDFAFIGTVDWTSAYMASVEHSEVVTEYPAAVYVRLLWKWTSEGTTTLDDVQTADLQIVQDTFKASVSDSISYLTDPVKKNCGLIKNSGRIFTADMLTITGTNVTVKDDHTSVFSQTAKRITASADGATAKLALDTAYAFDTVTVVFYLPYDSYKGDSPTALDLRIYANATTNTPIVSSSNCCWGWNFLKIPRNKMGLGQTLTLSSIDMVFKVTSGTTAAEFGEIIVDSIILDMEMVPTFILDFDQIWERSITNGAYDYLRENNIPYTVHTWQFANLNSAKVTEMKKAMLAGAEFSYYGGVTNESYMKDVTDYSDAIAECNRMENDIIPFTHKRFLTYGCGAHLMNPYLRESLEASGVKAIRGRWIQNPIGFFSEHSTWLPYSIEISYGNSTRAQIVAHVDEAVAHGSCVVAFTHGICDDDESVVGTASSAIRISDFEYMVDYLVSLRDQGKIQICTMEQFVNQCIGQ